MKFKTKRKQLKEMTDKYWKTKDETDKLNIDLDRVNERLEQRENEISEIETEFESYKNK